MAGSRIHRYDISIEWTGNAGSGTADYRGYRRTHDVRAPGRPDIAGTSDPAFRGETDRWNPEQLLVVSLSQCHMLWYLHLASEAGVIVTAYTDDAVGTMEQDADGRGGQFTEVVLHPSVTVADQSMRERAHAIHGRVGDVCFIARSVNFPVRHEPKTLVAG